MLIPVLITLFVGYLLGALPFGYLVARAHGVDIFKVGSGSPGATNVKRVLGSKAGNTVFALDALKGALAAGWPKALDWFWSSSATNGSVGTDSFVSTVMIGGVTILDFHYLVAMSLAGIVGALLGHSFSCFTRFKGGKGVATGAGGLLVLLPTATLIAGAIWVVTFYTSRYVSLASLVAAVVLPVAAWFLGRPPVLVGFAALIAVFVLIRHRANIQRLIAGTENRFTPKQSGGGPKA